MPTSPRRAIALIAIAFLLAAAATTMLAMHARRHFRTIQAQNEPIRAWMSIPFIAHSHHIPASVLYQAIGATPQEPRDHRSIGRIARETNRKPSDLEAQLQHAIDAAQAPPK